ncbi:MAG: hypothetical protein F6K32_17955 [Desertifilum sp. SIO1I2]|nr:hypothetical protein [Desertifilum sp. SIO1I2]
MKQEGKAGKNVIQAARDYNNITQIGILNGENIFLVPQQIVNFIKRFFEKDKIIRHLENELNEKKREIEKLKDIDNCYYEKWCQVNQQLQQARELVYGVSKQAYERGIHDDSINVMLHQLSQSLDDLNRQNKQAESYLKAALWVKTKRNAWIQEVTELIFDKYSNDILLTKKVDFQQDIVEYINWFYNSMMYAKPLRKTLDELNLSRSVDLSQPYRESFIYIKSKVTLEEGMLDEEFYALHKMIDFLIEQL